MRSDTPPHTFGEVMEIIRLFAIIELTFRTLFRTFAAIFEELPVEGGSGAIYGLFSCPITHCCYTIFPLITTSCQL
jgi:hypothetical protein